MAQSSLCVPLLTAGFYQLGDKNAVQAAGKTILNNYSDELAQTSLFSNVLKSIIMAIIFVESKGDPYAIGGKAIGLMQIDPTTADETIWMENSKHRLNDREKEVLRKMLGSRLDTICNKRMGTGATPRITNADLFNPEFNIQVGTIYLGLLIDEHTEGGIMRLDKVILRYNRGYYYKPASGSPAQVYAAIVKVNKISADYVLKVVGTNNVIQLMA